jgi:hypothetical protein
LDFLLISQNNLISEMVCNIAKMALPAILKVNKKAPTLICRWRAPALFQLALRLQFPSANGIVMPVFGDDFGYAGKGCTFQYGLVFGDSAIEFLRVCE